MIDILGTILVLGLVGCVIALEGYQVKESSIERKLREKMGLGLKWKKRRRDE